MSPHEEALRRIAEAERTGAEVLDLGDLALEELPPELGRLSRLRGLALGTGRLVLDEAGEVRWGPDPARTSHFFKDLEPLSGLSALEYLDLSGCYRLTTVELRELGALGSLRLDGCTGLTTVKLRELGALT